MLLVVGTPGAKECIEFSVTVRASVFVGSVDVRTSALGKERCRGIRHICRGRWSRYFKGIVVGSVFVAAVSGFVVHIVQFALAVRADGPQGVILGSNTEITLDDDRVDWCEGVSLFQTLPPLLAIMLKHVVV